MTNKYSAEEVEVARTLFADLDEDNGYRRRDFIELEKRIDAFIASQSKADLIRIISCLKYSSAYMAYKVSIKDKGKWDVNITTYKGKKAMALHTSYRRIPSYIAMRFNWYFSPHEYLYNDYYGTAECIILNPASDYVVLQRSLIEQVFGILNEMEKEYDEKDECEDKTEQLLEIMASIDLEMTKPIVFNYKLKNEETHNLFFVCGLPAKDEKSLLFKEQGKGYVEIPFIDAVHIPELTDYFNNNDGHFFYDNI